MKLILTGMVALAMAGAPLMARQEPQEDKDKPKQEEPKKPEPKPKPDTKPKQEPQPKPDEKQPPKPDKERAKQDEKQQREETRPAPQKQSAQRAPGEGHEQGGQARGGGRGKRIPEERFRTSFGREHHFHVRRDQRFQYGGYWFEVAEPWPAAWVFDDDCFVEEDGDTYYLVDALNPDIRVMVIVVEG